MTDMVVDASVGVKWVLREDFTEAARRLLRPPYEIIAPDLIWPEVGNVFWKRQRRGDIDQQQAIALFFSFGQIPIQIIGTQSLTMRSLDIALETSRTVYDCLYLALAEANGCRLVTADRRFYNALQGTTFADMLLWVEEIP
jgi:predicted nucleic acid-binding protein